MDSRLKFWITVAAPTGIAAAAAAACAWVLYEPARVQVAQSPPAVVEHCKRAAELLYEISWAAACFKSDDSNDCMLPDAQAAKVNAILATEEARCMAAETQASARH
jgi:hypothetical protein